MKIAERKKVIFLLTCERDQRWRRLSFYLIVGESREEEGNLPTYLWERVERKKVIFLLTCEREQRGRSSIWGHSWYWSCSRDCGRVIFQTSEHTIPVWFIQSYHNMVDWLLPHGFVKIYAISCFILWMKIVWGYEACSIIL